MDLVFEYKQVSQLSLGAFIFVSVFFFFFNCSKMVIEFELEIISFLMFVVCKHII